MQLDLFAEALEELARDSDIVNQVLEITLEGDSRVVQRYQLSKS